MDTMSGAVAPFLISQCYNTFNVTLSVMLAVAPFLISQCYNYTTNRKTMPYAVAPFLISQCYNASVLHSVSFKAVARSATIPAGNHCFACVL